MKWLNLFSVVLLAAVSSSALAQTCGDEDVRIGNSPNELRNFIRNRLVCGTATSVDSPDQWQEEHRQANASANGGELFERAKGVGDSVDPSKVVGTWNIQLNGQGNNRDDLICYTYTGGDNFCFRLYGNAGSAVYCDTGNTIANAFFLGIGGDCGFVSP